MINKCHNCGCEEFSSERTEQVFHIGEKLYLVKNIPAIICARCGEKYFTPATQEATLNLLQKENAMKYEISGKVYEFS